jgi:GT2 family glycosyltransferase
LPGVTVVVPTLNRGSYLLDTVRDLLAQEHRPLEILIVDQSDTVSTELEALVSAHPETISHHQVTFRGLPVARNYGWQLAKYDLLVYVDDDIRCGPGFIGGYARALAQESAGIIGGGIDGEAESVAERPGRYNRWLAVAETGFAATGSMSADHARGCNFGATQIALRRAGGFDERLNVGAALHEETELMLRAAEAGAPVRFDGSLRLTHLAAGGGGTRQTNWRRYVHALAHNRSILIRRHSRWYQRPVALAWSGKLVVAYTLHARDPRLVVDGVRGAIQGWRAGGLPPLCTPFDSERH